MKKFWNLYFKIGAAWGTCWAAAYAVRELTNAMPDEHPLMKAALRTLVAGTVWPLDMVDIAKKHMKEGK